MKKRQILKLMCVIFIASLSACEPGNNNSNTKVEFPEQGMLDSLKNGLIDKGTTEINQALINMLEYRKKFKNDKSNGVVLSKEFVTQAVNGYSESGINLPSDTSNYSLWDFMITYPGLEINEMGNQKFVPSILFYKGSIDDKGNFIPSGDPVSGMVFKGGGGGDGKGNTATPPPY